MAITGVVLNGLLTAANAPVPAALKLVGDGLAKGYFAKKEEALQQIILADLASGKYPIEELAKNHKFMGGYYRLFDAALKGVTNNNLRLLSKVLRNSIDVEIEVDELNFLLSTIADLTESEVELLAELWKCYQELDKNKRRGNSENLKLKLVPIKYLTVGHFDTAMLCLSRTGFLTPKDITIGGGSIYEPSPLMEKFVELAKLQIHNNVKL